MARAALEINAKTAERFIRRLDEVHQQRLIQKLVNERFEKAVKAFRENIKKQKLSPKDIHNIVEDTRQDFYEKSRR